MAELKEKRGQVWAAGKDFLVKRWPWVVAALALALLVLIYAGYRVPWTGFGQHPGTVSKDDRAKTLWDWLDLLLVPLILAAGAALFTWVTNKREQSVELDRARETALQAYLDRMTELLEKELRTSEPNDEKRHIARARTLTVLRQLDGERKGLLLRFLYESGLIGKRVFGEDGLQAHKALVDLDKADLRGADLRVAVLEGADLHGANLEGANLFLAELSYADLHGSDLEGANLYGTSLDEANLSGAILRQAVLSWSKVG